MTQEALGKAVAANAYLRIDAQGKKETWQEATWRALTESARTGNLSKAQIDWLYDLHKRYIVTASGRQLWCGGTDWAKLPENFAGLYNCVSIPVDEISAFKKLMGLGMMGCGTGADLRQKHIDKLPKIVNQVFIEIIGEFGTAQNPIKDTEFEWTNEKVTMTVGDSRQGWIGSYQALLDMATDPDLPSHIPLTIDLSHVRPAGKRLKGFGGVSNPVELPNLYKKVAAILNKAVGRQLTQQECTLIIDEAAVVVVAGNVRRSAGIRQYNPESPLLKKGMWRTDANGYFADESKHVHRVANHTRVFERRPTYQEIEDAVKEQFYSGEGAIQWAGEALARANSDLWATESEKRTFLSLYSIGHHHAEKYIQNMFQRRYAAEISPKELAHRLDRVGLNPCVPRDTWVHTEEGAKQVKDLVGKQFVAYVNGELFSSTPDGFWSTGYKAVYKVTTQEGYSLRLTSNHKLLKVTAQTQDRQYSEWIEAENLEPGDYILLHNHRELRPWEGEGTYAEGKVIGDLVGRSRYAKALLNSQEQLRTFGLDPQSGKAGRTLRPTVTDDVMALAKKFGVDEDSLIPSEETEKASYEFYRGFLYSAFSAYSSLNFHYKEGFNLHLNQVRDLGCLQVIQRMLARLGIISVISPEKDSNKRYDLRIVKDNILEFLRVIGLDEERAHQVQGVLLKSPGQMPEERFAVKIKGREFDCFEEVFDCTVPGVNRFDANGFTAHNCGEIIGSNYFCNLAEVCLKVLEPFDLKGQEEAFKAAGLLVSTLLHQEFVDERMNESRLLDPIVGVSFTGAFDFFVKLFGGDWLRWWMAGRPANWGEPVTSVPLGEEFSQSTVQEWEFQGQYYKAREAEYFQFWRKAARKSVHDYCEANGLKKPNRCTTVQPAGTKSLLTGASSGWHPPKAQRMIRRVTFRRGNPIALACKDLGCNVIPDSSCKDKDGRLLSDIHDERVDTWLVEFLLETEWAHIADEVGCDLSQLPALSQWDFYLNVQANYAEHNTSATIEFWEDEIPALSQRIFEAIDTDQGYISAALMGRFKDTKIFPRLPFEPISKKEFISLTEEVKQRATETDFDVALSKYIAVNPVEGAGPNPCDSEGCTLSK